jgi:hypothetical protein
MKSATWESCSEVSIDSQLRNLREIAANLTESLATTDEMRSKAAKAQSFVQMAIAALENVQAEPAVPDAVFQHILRPS